MADNLEIELKKTIQGEVVRDVKNLDTYSTDASLFTVRPQLAVWPKDVEDIKQLVKFVNKYRGSTGSPQLSLTARAAGTDMSGGPLTESIVVDVTKHLNNVIEVGPNYAITQPGVFYRDFEKETLKHGLIMPSYPASRQLCAMGGIVANNAGGEKTLAYGKVEKYVQEIKMVLRDGNEYTFRSLNNLELEQKKKQNDLEGEIYRSMHALIQENYEAIMAAKPKVSKNSAGYYLWNVWDKEKGTFDLSKMIVGSQGTFGIITETTFSLLRPKEHSTLLVIFLKDLARLAEVINKILKHQPESFESYDDHTASLAMRFLPDMIKLLGAKNILTLAWQFLPEVGMVLTGGLPKLILEAEFTGDSEEEIYAKARAAQADLADFGVKTRITKDDREEQKYWTIRRESFNLLRHHVQGKKTMPFIDDICVRPEFLPKFLPRLSAIMDEYDWIYTVAGHVGDGNFHIIPLAKVNDTRAQKIITELSEKVYSLVLEYGGTIDGEHNDGIIRTPFLKKMYGNKIVSLFEQTKKIWDPDNIFNPGKKVNGTLDYAFKHLKTN